MKRFNITFVELDLSTFKDGWAKEIASREILSNFIKQEYRDDLFILSDADEIPSLRQLEVLLSRKGLCHFCTPTSYRRANWMLKDSHKNWARGVMGLTAQMPEENGGRFTKLPILDLGIDNGVHLSYLDTTTAATLHKLPRVLDHGFDWSLLANPEMLQMADKYQIDHLGRARNKGFGVLKVLQRENLPPILKDLYEYNPRLFEFNVAKVFPKRLIASILLSTYVNQAKHLKNIKQHDWIEPKPNSIKRKIFFPFLIEFFQVSFKALYRFLKF